MISIRISWNLYPTANWAEWNLNCIFHGTSLLLLDHITYIPLHHIHVEYTSYIQCLYIPLKEQDLLYYSMISACLWGIGGMRNGPNSPWAWNQLNRCNFQRFYLHKCRHGIKTRTDGHWKFPMVRDSCYTIKYINGHLITPWLASWMETALCLMNSIKWFVPHCKYIR